jgi:hypothetical protein
VTAAGPAVVLSPGRTMPVPVHPCSTGIAVAALARPEWLVGIEATPVIANRGRNA